MELEYLNSVKKQFTYYKALGEKTFVQLEDNDFFWQYNAQSNSIAIIVNHLWGNMTSRWTDFLISDGEKEWRERDLEFDDIIKTKAELLEKWQIGWDCLFEALASVKQENFNTEILIRNQSHSISEALNRQLAHYAYHIGQIVYLGRMLKSDSWQSLSIPKGDSKLFNKEKFSKGKHGGHFTDDIL
ncbi:DUF1572 family protein [Sediminibacter sp. Hel_I_10]|uniref:DUF1572 family protein n=1 Tax=Sediminibacter sp. Hel_I_10 TaxID=1392490 RepID=UPI00047CD64F|nr:DUF1572 family protein [Sediminibacter sp. Hel_I_10]